MLRECFTRRVRDALRRSPVVALLGPRQAGKTTLARQVVEAGDLAFRDRLNYFDLEDPAHVERLATPRLALDSLTGLVVIDEVQHRPNLFPVLRVLVDRPDNPARFLVLGSASRDLIRQSSESLAGRIEFVEVTPFGLAEVGSEHLDALWLRGGFPPSFLAPSDDDAWHWRDNYIRTFLERDIPSLGVRVPALTLRRFWMMLAHYHGQVFNASEIGKSLGVADTTASRYLDLLAGTFVVRRLLPWFENIGKRQVKTPKIYFRDSGILHHLIGVAGMAQLVTHPKLGASWEGFAIEQVIRWGAATAEETFFWGVHNQAELDLLAFSRGRRVGYEVKYSDAPRLTASHRMALEVLRLDSLTVVTPGAVDYLLADKVRVVGLANLIAETAPAA